VRREILVVVSHEKQQVTHTSGTEPSSSSKTPRMAGEQPCRQSRAEILQKNGGITLVAWEIRL
jgi:hypothetical protein